MTSEEKQKKAEEKARRRAEAAERSAKRRTQLAALTRYWSIIRYDINGRACPQDFFLFWERQLLFASQKILPVLLDSLGEILRKLTILPVVIIILAILCAIFPPVLFIVAIILTSLAIGVNMLINGALVGAAAYSPIFLAGVKRRINDMSTTAAAAHVRFLLFVLSGVATLAAFIVSSLSWFCKVSAFMQGGSMFWLTSLAYVLMCAGIVILIWQVHYYSYCPGVSGSNFAGTNPVEVEISDESLAGHGSRMASRSWQVMSIALVVVVSLVAFALSSQFMEEIGGVWAALDLDMSDLFKMLDYGVLGVITIGCLIVSCVGGKYKKGLLAKSEIDSINECFVAKSDAFAEEMKKKAIQAAEDESKKRAGSAKTTFGLIGLIARTVMAFIYWCTLFMTIVSLFRGNFVLAIMLIVMTLAAVACYNHFKSNVGTSLKAINWQALIRDSGKQLLHFGREVVLLPFTLSDAKSPDDTKLPAIAEKRLRVRNLSFIDPLGIHQFALGRPEMGGIQILFCLLFVGIPISWLWSIFDGIRYSKMSDEEFLVEYHDYCCANGLMDKFVRLVSKIAIGVVPIIGAVVLLFIAITLENTPANGDTSHETIYGNPVKECQRQAERTQQAVDSLLGVDDKEFQQGVEEFRQATKELEKQTKELEKQFRDFDKAIQQELDGISW